MNKIEVGMNYFNLYYPFLEGAVNPFGYSLPTHSFEAQMVE
jgi:hypothetical protein